jgi:hypothetical protein
VKITFGQIKADVAKVTNLNAGDARVKSYVNRACERLLYEGKQSIDSTARYTVCANDACLTWPREIEAIEAVTICDSPATVRNQWYEFLEGGPGTTGANGCSDGCGPYLTLKDRGSAVAFDDIKGTGNKIAVSCDGAEAAGLKILIRYYDSTAQKVYTNSGGAIIEGEYVALPVSPAYSYTAKQVLPFGLYDVIKPVTSFPVRLWEYNVAAATYRALAFYEPDEELPVYRRSRLSNLGSCGGNCESQKVTVIAKRRFIPVVDDNSVLIIPHRDAIRLGAQAVKREEDSMIQEAAMYWQLAIQCLDRQRRHYEGDGVVAPIRMVGAETWGGGVYNLQ